MVGCTSDFGFSGLGSSSSPFGSASYSSNEVSVSSDSASDSARQTMEMVNQQMAIDAANAAAQQQFNDAMAATQLFENQHNDEFNQNGLH